MASLGNRTIYNTELFNIVLEAMDNFKPILFCGNKGAIQMFSPSNAYLKDTNGKFQISVFLESGYTLIYPSETATSADLYVPKNISPYSQQEPSAM